MPEPQEWRVLMSSNMEFIRLRGRVVVGSIIFLAVILFGITASHAGEIVPSIGLTKALNGEPDAQVYSGVAFRGSLAPLIKTELALAYRSESRYDDQLTV